MDLRCVFWSLCILPLSFFAQAFHLNQNLHQSITTDIIDFGYRQTAADAKKGLLKRLDNSYLGQYTDSNNAFIAATPLCVFSVGSENNEPSIRYQNSRGLMILGGYRKFKCHGMLMENQAVFNTFQRDFITQHGEFYPAATGYNQQNGMIPGMGRTKPYHEEGFDFAFSQGGFDWDISRNITVFGGNQSMDFSPGLRSVFWSQHNQALMAGGIIKIGKRLAYLVTRARLFDLIRRPVYANVESPYYKKNLALQAVYLTFEKHRLGIIQQTIWNAGDSLTEKPVNPLFWAPFPGLDRAVKKGVSLPQIGLTYTWNPVSSFLLYTELFSRGFVKNAFATQLGMKYYTPLKTNLSISAMVSWIKTGSGFYGTHYADNFTHQNLPLGTLLGNGSQEWIWTSRITYRRFFLDYFFQRSLLDDAAQPLFIQTYIRPERVAQHRMDIGFLVSDIMNLELFFGILTRKSVGFKTCNSLAFGLKTAIFKPNHVY